MVLCFIIFIMSLCIRKRAGPAVYVDDSEENDYFISQIIEILITQHQFYINCKGESSITNVGIVESKFVLIKFKVLYEIKSWHISITSGSTFPHGMPTVTWKWFQHACHVHCNEYL